MALSSLTNWNIQEVAARLVAYFDTFWFVYEIVFHCISLVVFGSYFQIIYLTVLGLPHCGLFCSCGKWGCCLVLVPGLPIVVASLVSEHGLWDVQTSGAVARGLSSCSSWAREHRLNSCGARLSCSKVSGIFPDQGSSTLAGGFFTTEALGKHRLSILHTSSVQFSSTPWTAALQASLSITNSWSSLRLTSIESAMPSSHLILCRPFLLLPPISPIIRVFSNESTLRMRWPKYWSFIFSIMPSKIIPGLIFWISTA